MFVVLQKFLNGRRRNVFFSPFLTVKVKKIATLGFGGSVAQHSTLAAQTSFDSSENVFPHV